ncbi:MAG TPA: trypsin-like serine protease, partial [Solirubrobacterales bacterium]|nr:trypsin-like serine protease [Solirubrobacterales bacterium]
SPVVHELQVLPSGAATPIEVAGRPPLPRFRRTSAAAASSLRVIDALADGTRTNGKILAVSPGQGAYSCSGTALNTPSRSIVLTAGHCVLEHQRAGRRIVFVPAYDHGKRPFGTFEVQAVYAMPQWRRSENPAFDLAALRVSPNQLGYLTDVVGARGYVSSKSRFSAFQIFGYPAAALRGEELRSCRAHGLGADPLTNPFGGPPTMPASCDMAAGASGGAWLLDGEYVSGVTSYSYAGRPTRLHSPYFGPAIGAFLQRLP